ncbi:MAG: cytochrome c [Hyphomicrobiales bacterium]|nr:cytochrome c [Hyphomicrobiales bacterium]
MHSEKSVALALPSAGFFSAVLAFMLAAGFVLHGTAGLRADETDIVLKEGNGRDAVLNNCGACHSLDYIKMNSPFLDKTGWEGEVTKMIKAYGAPIDDPDAKQIAAYLAANYGK